MLKSHKQCLALLCLAFFTTSRPFALSLFSLYLLPAFCFVQRSGEKRVKMRAIWKGNDRAGQTGRKRGMRERETWRNGEQDKKPACVEESNEPRNLADATAASTSNRATLLPPFPLWIPLQEAWNKTVIKSTRGWRCGRQWKSKSWLEPAPLTIGLSSARVGGTSPSRVTLRRSRKEGIFSVKGNGCRHVSKCRPRWFILHSIDWRHVATA